MTSGTTAHSLDRASGARTLAQRAAATLPALALVGLAALVIAMVLALAVAMVPAEELAKSPPSAATPPAAATAPSASNTAETAPVDSFAVTADTSIVFVVETGNRMFPDWKETRRVHLHEQFVIGDTQNSAVVTKLLPDFRIDNGRFVSVSDQLNNPAVRVLVFKDSAAVDSSWAFKNFPPHFSPRSFYTFQLKEVLGYAAASVPAVQPDASNPANKERSEHAMEPRHEGGSSFSKED